ncbi:hypothetical protein GSB9_02831 [Flavobacteriaceae bacterium GSB9]|nr:hypothetical protein GSB9_02831 [Flavobacteriaceae bacterium GSB9]
MKPYIKISFLGLIASILFAVFAFFSCEAALNCLKGLKPPEFPSKQLKIAYLGQAYYDDLIPYVPQRTNTDVYVWDFQIEG